MLSDKHLEHVCCLLQGAKCCRYVVEDDNRIGVYHCQKRTSEKEKIDENVKNIIEVHKKRGTEPTVPMGDNCYGYVSGFKYLEQGYDKDKN
jgi:hypothetical protein